MRQIRVADFGIDCGRVALQSSNRLKIFKSFGFDADIESRITWSKQIERPLNEKLIVKDQWNRDEDTESLEWYFDGKNYTVIFLNNEQIAGKIIFSNGYKRAHGQYNDDLKQYGYNIYESFLSLQFRNFIYSQRGFILHASAIQIRGRCLLFSASSGTGKSTHTSLWEKYRGAVVINDDSPAIRLASNNAYAYGTPWSGSSEKYANAKLPIEGIVFLEQGVENIIEKLTPGEAIFYLMPRFMLPYQDSVLMNSAVENTEALLAAVSIYRLKCTPDLRAVETVEMALGW